MLRQRLWVCPYEHAKWPSLLQRISLCFCLTLGRHSASAALVYKYRGDLGTDKPWINTAMSLQFDLATGLSNFLNLLDAERAHNMGIWAAKHGIVPREVRADHPSLHLTLWDRRFRNPLGLAAGFDKDAEAVEGLLGMGFGFVEIGSVTPLPQAGNPKPRAFRLPELRGVINRFGFNSAGVDVVGANLAAFRDRTNYEPARSLRPGLVGVNVGKNKVTDDAAADYVLCISKLAQHADYLVVNVSSPNTPGLRGLQGRKELDVLITKVKAARDQLPWGALGPPPLLVKIAPDLPPSERKDVATVVLRHNLQGIVVGNTTLNRPQPVLDHPCGAEAGGLSGEPLREEAHAALRDMYVLTGGKVPIVGCGGISSGRHAYQRIRAGASLVQLYTGIAYGGPALLPDLKKELAECLAADGFRHVQDAVGADHR